MFSTSAKCRHVKLLALRAWPATVLAVYQCVPRTAAPRPPSKNTTTLTATEHLVGNTTTRCYWTPGWGKSFYGTLGTGTSYVDRCHCTPSLAWLAGRDLPGLLRALACRAPHSVVLEVPPQHSPRLAPPTKAPPLPPWLPAGASTPAAGLRAELYSPLVGLVRRVVELCRGLPHVVVSLFVHHRLVVVPHFRQVHLFEVRRVPEKAWRGRLLGVCFPLAVHEERCPLSAKRRHQTSGLVPGLSPVSRMGLSGPTAASAVAAGSERPVGGSGGFLDTCTPQTPITAPLPGG